MTPYYQDELATIYHGDCLEIMPGIERDAVVTDAPYGVGLNQKQAKGNHGAKPYCDDPEHIEALIQNVGPAIAAGRALVFCGTRMMFSWPRPVEVGAVWIPAGAGIGRWGWTWYQPILYYGADPYLANGKGGRPNGFQSPGPGPTGTGHPCPKPIEWMTWAVTRASLHGDVIMDPFAGSGTTLRAAKDLGRKSIGIEIEERYCEIAAKRLAQEVLFP